MDSCAKICVFLSLIVKFIKLQKDFRCFDSDFHFLLDSCIELLETHQSYYVVNTNEIIWFKRILSDLCIDYTQFSDCVVRKEKKDLILSELKAVKTILKARGRLEGYCGLQTMVKSLVNSVKYYNEINDRLRS